ncbi:type 1 fimbrial protein [Burkholderia sp. Se-20378]|nr:type 1 fimbrial protein [Burkholderia sp. Se-20378]
MKAKKILAGAAMVAFSSAAIAAGSESVDGMISFQGTIVNDTCKVSSATGDARSIIVNMGTIAADEVGTVAAPRFSANGSSAVKFAIMCKKGGKVSMKFAAQGAELDADNKSIRVNSGSPAPGYAQNVSIAVYKDTSAGEPAFDLSNGDLLAETKLPDEGGSVNVSFAAAYVAQDPSKVTAGIANASLPFTLSYE